MNQEKIQLEVNRILERTTIEKLNKIIKFGIKAHNLLDEQTDNFYGFGKNIRYYNTNLSRNRLLHHAITTSNNRHDNYDAYIKGSCVLIAIIYKDSNRVYTLDTAYKNITKIDNAIVLHSKYFDIEAANKVINNLMNDNTTYRTSNILSCMYYKGLLNNDYRALLYSIIKSMSELGIYDKITNKDNIEALMIIPLY